MNLLIDIGNARIKWAVQNGDDWTRGTALAYRNKAFKDVARPAWKELEAPQRVLVCNVAGEDYAKAVRTWVKRRWKITPEFLHAGAEACGVSNAYSEPAKLGADRWAALIAARAHHRRAAVIIDCGTAITVDALAADGMHLGGLIVPGMELMSSALTARAPLVEVEACGDQEDALLGRSTAAAVTGGILYAVVSLVDRVCMDVKAEIGSRAVTLLTGGDAERILPLLAQRPIHEPDLVLQGLAVIAEEAPSALSDL